MGLPPAERTAATVAPVPLRQRPVPVGPDSRITLRCNCGVLEPGVWRVAPDVRRNRRRAVTTKDSRPHGVVRIALVSPPLDASGGIGRLMSYVMTGLDLDQIRIRHIDSRGRSNSPILSALPLLRACVVLIVLRARRRVDLAH